MKVSIWQQWASNHSNNFVVVGEFPSIEEANAAALKWQDMLNLIAQFREGYGEKEPTGPEVQFAKEYQVEWKETLSWLYSGPELELNAVPTYISTLDRYVFISSGSNDFYGLTEPVDQIMNRFTEKVWVGGEHTQKGIRVKITCVAPDVITAQVIYEVAQPYLRSEDNKPIPWIAYAWGQRHPQADQIVEAQKLRFELKQERNQLNQALLKLQQLQKLHEQEVAELRAHYQHLDAKLRGQPLMDIMMTASYNTWATGEVERQDAHLHIDMQFSAHLGTGLRAVTAWLKDKGCTDIQVELREGN